MGNKFVMDKNDYDFYQFGIPFSVLVGKRRNKFILAELGKRHPCFSDEFCFDSKLVLDRKGILSEVVVMNKYRLSQMRCALPGKRLGICEKRDSFFDTGIVAVWKKWWPVVLLGMLFMVVSIFCAGVGNSRQQNVSVVAGAEMNLTENVELGDGVAISAFFETVKNNKGRINWLEWRIDGRNENFTTEVGLMFPEQIIGIDEKFLVSSVSYAEGVPLMVVNANKTYANGSIQGGIADYVSFAPLVRDVLKSERAEKVEIIEESIKPYSIRFSFLDVCGDGKNVVRRLSDFVKGNDISVSYLKIRYAGDSIFDVQLDFSSFAAGGIDLELVGSNLEFFKRSVAKKKEVQVALHEGKPEEAFGMKMGEVTYADGSKLVFYKTPQGKTVKRKEFSK